MSAPIQPSTECPYELWDGAYVLGSLSPAERREFEAHLDGCGTCSRAVRDLAGLPGLLGRIGPEVFEESEPDPVPETLMPRLARAVRRDRQRRTWLTAGIAAAAAVAITVGGAMVLDRPSSSAPTATPTSVVTSPAQPMTQLGPDPMTASVSLTPVAWGTRFDLTCVYPPNTVSYEGGAYALVVHTKDGRTERVATWNGLPGRLMHVTGASAARTGEISRVEVKQVPGPPVLELSL
jgi:Putative zinc-finger